MSSRDDTFMHVDATKPWKGKKPFVAAVRVLRRPTARDMRHGCRPPAYGTPMVGLSELSGLSLHRHDNVCVWMSLLQEDLAACALSRMGMP